MDQQINPKLKSQNGITILTIVLATIAIIVDRDYYKISVRQDQRNFEKNYRRDSIMQALEIQLTQAQLDLLNKQIKYDSQSLAKQLAIAQAQLSGQLLEKSNQEFSDREKVRRVLWDINRLQPHQGISIYREWSNPEFHTFIQKTYALLEQEATNPLVVNNKKMGKIWHTLMKRIEYSRISYEDTTQVKFVGNEPWKTIGENWSDQRHRDGEFIFERTLALQLIFRNREVPPYLLE